MPATRRLVVRRLEELATGTGRSGRPWRLLRVEAEDPDGTPIAESLTTFQRLPTDEVIEVRVERREDPRYGSSFTLKLPQRGGELRQRVEELERRVAALEAHLGDEARAAA
jgi:hypothetical protein